MSKHIIGYMHMQMENLKFRVPVLALEEIWSPHEVGWTFNDQKFPAVADLATLGTIKALVRGLDDDAVRQLLEGAIDQAQHRAISNLPRGFQFVEAPERKGAPDRGR